MSQRAFTPQPLQVDVRFYLVFISLGTHGCSGLINLHINAAGYKQRAKDAVFRRVSVQFIWFCSLKVRPCSGFDTESIGSSFFSISCLFSCSASQNPKSSEGKFAIWIYFLIALQWRRLMRAVIFLQTLLAWRNQPFKDIQVFFVFVILTCMLGFSFHTPAHDITSLLT